jgi:hypothetical protein
MAEGSDGWKKTLYEQLATECNAMLRYALSYGLVVNPTICEVVTAALGESPNPPTIVTLTKAHRLLATIVAPAEPHAILLVHGVRWHRIRLLRYFVAVAILSMLAMLGLGMSPLISASPNAGNPLMSNGLALLVNQLFFISIASLGACFHGLFTVNRYIILSTYDPNYETTYLVRYLLGVMSGLILASLIDVDPNSAIYALARPLLALIGGFSASVVYRVLHRLVETVERLIGVDMEKVEAKQRSRDIEEPVDLLDDIRSSQVEQPETVVALLKPPPEATPPPETTPPPEATPPPETTQPPEATPAATALG